MILNLVFFAEIDNPIRAYIIEHLILFIFRNTLVIVRSTKDNAINKFDRF